MIKLSKDIGIALLAAAAACSSGPAPAAVLFKIHGWTCHDHTFMELGNGKPITQVFLKDLKACFELCDKTDGCVAVQWVEQTTGPNQFAFCTLYASAKHILPATHDPHHVSCLKPPSQTYQDIQPKILPKIPHEQYRQQPKPPTPQPSQTPGGRR